MLLYSDTCSAFDIQFCKSTFILTAEVGSVHKHRSFSSTFLLLLPLYYKILIVSLQNTNTDCARTWNFNQMTIPPLAVHCTIVLSIPNFDCACERLSLWGEWKEYLLEGLLGKEYTREPCPGCRGRAVMSETMVCVHSLSQSLFLLLFDVTSSFAAIPYEGGCLFTSQKYLSESRVNSCVCWRRKIAAGYRGMKGTIRPLAYCLQCVSSWCVWCLWSRLRKHECSHLKCLFIVCKFNTIY